MMKLDQVNSPPWLASMVASCLPADLPGSVFDPAVGAGALLSAVRERFGPSVGLIGADVDTHVVAKLKKDQPTWTISEADALRAHSRSSSRAWQLARIGASAIVMNPPFSFRGQGGVLIDLEAKSVRVSPAAAFLATALQRVMPSHGAVAILPSGSMQGEKDVAVWEWLNSRYQVDVVADLRPGTFPGVAARTLVAQLVPRVNAPVESSAPERIYVSRQHSWKDCVCVDVVRGRVPLHEAQTHDMKDAELVHTTDLANGTLHTPTRRADSRYITPGVGVLLPRVGKPDASKIAVSRHDIVLSDCLFLVRPRDYERLEELRGELTANYAALEHRGTGAPHLTASQITRWLESMGYLARITSASGAQEPCICTRSQELFVA